MFALLDMKTNKKLSTSEQISKENIVFFSVDNNYNYTSFNNNLKSLVKTLFHFNLKAGMSVLDCIELPEVRAIAKKSIDRALQGEPYSEIHFEHFTKNYFEVIWFPTYQSKKIVGASAFIQNINERKYLEKTIESSKERYLTLVSNLHFGVLVQGPNAEILISNPKALELLGLTEDQLLGKTSFDTDWNVIHEDGSPYPGSTHPVPHCIATRQSVRNAVMGVYRPTTQDRVWLKVDAEPVFDSSGNVKEVICAFKDITEPKKLRESLKESEANLKRAQKIAKIGSWEWNPKSNEFNHSDGILNILGIEDVTAIRTPELLVSNFVHPDERQLVMEAGTKTMETGMGSPIVYRMLRADGKLIWVRVTSELEFHSGELQKIFGTTQDITDQKNTEQLIKESEIKYRELVENTPSAVAIHVNGIVVYINKQAVTLLGAKSIDDIIGKPVLSVVHPDSKEAVINRIRTLGEQVQDYSFLEEKFIRFDGTVVDVEVKAVPIIYENEEAVLTITNDISQRKQAEYAIAESRAKYMALSDASFDSIFLSEKGICFEQNNMAELMFGYTSQEAIGKSGDKWLIPEDREMVRRNMLAGITEPYEATALRKDGTTFPCLLHGKTMPFKGREIRVTSLNDITARKFAEKAIVESEQKYRELVVNFPVGIVIYVKGIIVFVNKQMLTILKAKSELELVGKKTLSFVHPDYIAIMAEIMNSEPYENVELSSIEEKLICIDQSTVEVFVKTMPIKFDGKDAVQLIITDISKSKKDEAELLKLNRLLNLNSEINDVILRTNNREKLLQGVCDAVVLHSKFRMIWIGSVDNTSGNIIPNTWAGFEDGYLKAIGQLSVKNIPQGQGPTGKAIREGKTSVCNDIENDPMMKPWRQEALKRNYHSSIAIPIKYRNTSLGIFTLYSEEKNFFANKEEIALLEKIAENIAFSLMAISNEAERLHAMEALKQSGERYKTLFDKASEGILFLTPAGKIIGLNESFAKMHGYNIDELIDKNLFDIDTPETAKMLPINLASLVPGKGIKIEVDHIRKDGSIISLAVSSSLILVGNQPYIQAFHTDITERKQAEKLNSLSNKVLRLLNSNVNTKIMISQLLSSIREVIGVDAVALRLKEGEDYPYFAHQGFSNDFLSHENSILSKDFEGKNCLDKNGKPKLECTCGFVISNNSNKKHPLLTKAGSFFTNNSYILIDLPAELDPRFRPRNKCIHYGYGSFAIIPINVNDFTIGLLQLNFKKTEAFTLEIINAFESICLNIGIELMRKKAEEELILANKELAIQTEQKVKHAAKLIIANELAKQNEEKAKLTDQLLIANKELHQYAYIASHDLQEPLRTVSNYMQIFEEDYQDKLDEKGKKYIRSIDKATKRMSALIKSLLDFSRLGQNSKVVTVDLNKSVKDVLADLNTLITNSGAELNVGNMPIMNVYEIEIRQVFQNLISNAIKFRRKETKPIVYLYAQEEKGIWRFTVEDNGIGIDSEHFERIFEIFQRLHKNEDEFEGKGIGLANCKKIIQQHLGEIWVESELGKGTKFHFTINNLKL